MGVWPIRASGAPVHARPAAFRGWNPTPYANHPLKSNAGGKLRILSHPHLRSTTEPIATVDSIFGSEDQKQGFFDLRVSETEAQNPEV